jgi:exopolysaccharide production protein ExoZ
MVYTTNQKPVGPLAFLLNRMARVAPIYWLLTCAVFMIALAAPQILGNTDANVINLAKSLLFIPYERSDGSVRPVLFVGWSLNYEMFFYVIFALSLAMKNKISKYALSLGIIIGLVILGDIFRPAQPELQFLTRPIILEFASGMLLAEVYPWLPTTKQAGYVAAAVLCAAFAVLIPSALIDGIWYPIAALPASLIVGAALVLDRAGIVPEWRTGLLIGNASYSLYLTHPFVAQTLTKMAQRHQMLTPRTAPFIVLAILIASCITAMVIWRFVEVPLGRYAKRLLDAPPLRLRRSHTRMKPGVSG